MAKPRGKWDMNAFYRKLKEGRGMGTGPDYNPFIHIHDIASLGICSRVKSETVGRIHHLLSRNELAFFYILDFDDNVIDIREQYPLLNPEDPYDLEWPVRLAEDAGIRYPRCSRSQCPYVMTSDFMVTTTTGYHVYSIKEATCKIES